MRAASCSGMFAITLNSASFSTIRMLCFALTFSKFSTRVRATIPSKGARIRVSSTAFWARSTFVRATS